MGRPLNIESEWLIGGPVGFSRLSFNSSNSYYLLVQTVTKG